jgi:lipoate-protein ligase A
LCTRSGSAYPSATWRLVVDGEADGATNMALDEAILDAVIDGASPPTLRFYSWSPPCLSLGRSQPSSDVDREACRAVGVDVVRRPTGGKAILHTDELTYSVALLQADARATGDIAESYRRLSEGLLAGLRRLGVPAMQAAGKKQHPAGPPPPGAPAPVPSLLTAVCFETPSEYEIVAGGRKLVGSAQWRARGGVLQHGTLPLRGDITRIVDYLAFSEAEREAQRTALRARACTLEEVLSRAVAFQDAAGALAEGWAGALDLALVPGELTAQERSHALKIRRRYTDAAWLERV